MCLIFFSINQHPTYKLILAANRDEFYGRKTQPAGFWANHENILGGCDLEAISPDGNCGTWMGISTSGKLAFVTNYRDPLHIDPKAPSRGHLVTDYLIGNENPASYMETVAERASQYNGFNLIVGNTEQLYYFSNYQHEIKKLSTGFYGLSNHLLDTPWPKITRGKLAIEQELNQQEINIESLFSLLRDENRAPDDQLPDTGIGLERERALSSMFIKTNGYGTRCSTIILIKHNGDMEFLERNYNLTDFTFETKVFKFRIS